jgi:hypothetical protein
LPIRLGVVQESPPPDRHRATYYETAGYHNGARARDEGRTTQCRVTDQVSDSWICLKHDRHILICLNERVEAEVRELQRSRSRRSPS